MHTNLSSLLGSMRFRYIRLYSLLFAGVLVSGCANLSAVREFAKESESLGSHRAVPGDFVSTNVRMQALYGHEESDEQLAPLKTYQELFEQRQAVLVKYLGALASLADNDVISFKKNFDEASGAASKAGVMEKSDADLFASVANLIARAATDVARRRLIRDTVTRCDPAIQSLAGAMAETVRFDYGSSLDREKQAIGSLLMDVEKMPNGLGVLRLAKYTMREHSLALAQRQKSKEAFAEALEKIAQGHTRLAGHIGDFSSKEFVAEIKGYEDEIKELHNQLKN